MDGIKVQGTDIVAVCAVMGILYHDLIQLAGKFFHIKKGHKIFLFLTIYLVQITFLPKEKAAKNQAQGCQSFLQLDDRSSSLP